MAVKFHGKVLTGEATTSQRALLARLEGKVNYGQKISKAEASKRIDSALAKQNGKAKVKPTAKTGEATVGQRVLLARLEGKVNFGKKISFAEASNRIAKLLRK